MRNAIQPYEKIVRLKPESAKGGDKLSRPFATQPVSATLDGLSRVAAATLREIRKDDRHLAQGGVQFVPPLAARVDHFEHVLEMLAVGEPA